MSRFSTSPFAALAVAALTSFASPAWAKFTPPPAPTGNVATTAGWLSPADLRTIEQETDAIHLQSGYVVDVLVVGSLEGETIEDVANETFQAWKPGDKGKDNGILLVFAPNFPAAERKVRIIEGKGAADALTPAEAKDILQRIIEPRIKGDDVRAAIAAGLAAIAQALKDGGRASVDAGPPDAGAQAKSVDVHTSDDGSMGMIAGYGVVGLGVIGALLYFARKRATKG